MHAWILFVFCVLFSFSPSAVAYLTNSNSQASSFSQNAKIKVPKIVFPIVWTILYALLAGALFWTLTHAGCCKGLLVGLYALNILLNAAWSPTFFRLRRPGAALALTLGMIGVASTIVAIHAKHREFLPMALVIPYLAWLAFAAFLNVQYLK